MQEDDLKNSKKSRLDDHEPLAIDTGRTDYSTGNSSMDYALAKKRSIDNMS